MSLEEQISKGIMEAMKAKDPVRLSALRNAKKYIIEAKTSGPGITELPDADVLKILTKLAKQGTDSAAIFTEQHRPELAAEELAQVAVYQEFLPKPLTDEELTAEVKAIIPGRRPGGLPPEPAHRPDGHLLPMGRHRRAEGPRTAGLGCTCSKSCIAT